MEKHRLEQIQEIVNNWDSGKENAEACMQVIKDIISKQPVVDFNTALKRLYNE